MCNNINNNNRKDKWLKELNSCKVLKFYKKYHNTNYK